MIDQLTSLATLTAYKGKLHTACAAFDAAVVQTPVGYTFNGDRWKDVNKVIQEWQYALDNCILAGLADDVNGFFHDRHYVNKVTNEVNGHLQSVFQVFKVLGEFKFRYKLKTLEPPPLGLEIVFQYLHQFGNGRSRQLTGKLVPYLPAYLLQLYRKDLAERRRRTGLWFFSMSALTVFTTFVLSRILGGYTRPALGIACALGLGAVSLGLLLMATARLPVIRGGIFKAAGAIVVTVFFLINPPIEEGRFRVQFVLKGPDGTPILREVYPALRLDSNMQVAMHPHRGIYYEFDSLSGRYQNTTLTLSVGGKWIFPSGQPDMTFEIGNDSVQTFVASLIRNPETLTVHGKLQVTKPVRYDVANFPALSGTTDPAGNVLFRLPDSFEGSDVLVSYLNQHGRREERTLQVDKVYPTLDRTAAKDH